MGSLLDQQLCIWESLNIFIVVFSLVQLNKKRNSDKHTEIFLEFLVSLNKQIKKGKSKNKKNYLHGKAPNKQKKNKEICLGFLFSSKISMHRK